MADIEAAKREMESLESHFEFLERNDGRVFFYTSFKGYVPVSEEVAELAIATEKAKVASRIAAIKQKFKDIGITFAQRDADFGSWKV